MRYQEGLPISLVEECELDSSGILRGCPDSSKAYGLPEEAVRLFVLIAAAGEGGLTQNRVPRDMRETLAETLLPLELQGLVTWERDARGRNAYLVLTWKGEDALAAARPKQQTPTVNPRRRMLNSKVS